MRGLENPARFQIFIEILFFLNSLISAFSKKFGSHYISNTNERLYFINFSWKKFFQITGKRNSFEKIPGLRFRISFQFQSTLWNHPLLIPLKQFQDYGKAFWGKAFQIWIIWRNEQNYWINWIDRTFEVYSISTPFVCMIIFLARIEFFKLSQSQ